MDIRVTSSSPEETRRLGAALGRLLGPGDLVCLFGDLGSGKTTFAQGVAEALGVSGPVTSPTFTIANEYEGTLPFYHLDAYRLEGEDSLAELGLEQYLGGEGVTLLEWAECLEDLLPESFLSIRLEGGSQEGERIISLKATGSGYEKVLEGWTRHAGAGHR